MSKNKKRPWQSQGRLKNESIKELLWTKKEADSAEDYPSTDILFLFCIVHESRSAMFW